MCSLIGYSEDPPKTDADRIQGTWGIARVERNGKDQPKDPLFTIKISFEGDKLLAKVGRRPAEPKGTFKLDPAQTPKAYDVTTDLGIAVKGIYELEGDVLKVCLSAPGADRPTAMKTEPDDERTLIVYKREKPTRSP